MDPTLSQFASIAIGVLVTVALLAATHWMGPDEGSEGDDDD